MGAHTKLRRATLQDVQLLAANVAEGLSSYRDWAPADWSPPALDDASLGRLAGRLAQPDVWCLLAVEGDQAAGHVGLSRVTAEDPEPAPAGVINLWQLFVRTRWQGTGLGAMLMDAAVAEARLGGYAQMRLWTPRGAARARRFYEREGWTRTGRRHERSPTGLPTLEYARTTGAQLDGATS